MSILNWRETFQKYQEDPFAFMDNLRPTLFGHVFNPYFKYRLNRRVAFLFAIFLGLLPWILFGFDSCIAQPLMMLYRMPEYILGHLTYHQWIQETWIAYYGKEFHYSAFLIYGLAYWALSRHYEQLGIVQSKNVAYSCSILFLSIGLFEWYWMFSYAYFQRQPWIITLKWPQLRILLQNLAFTVLGVLGILYMWADAHFHPLQKHMRLKKPWYKFRWNVLVLLLIALSIGLGLLWWFYPWHVKHITVEFETGTTWTNSANFPQTLYTLDINPLDKEIAGVWYFVENNAIHAMNTLVKVSWTLTIVYIGCVKKLEKEK